MRYQALILLFIILFSSYLFRETSVFSQSGGRLNQQQATVVDSLNLGSTNKTIEKNESQISSIQNSSSSGVIAPTSSSATQIAPPDIAKPSTQTESVVIEQPLIQDAGTAINQLCTPISAKIFIAQTIDGASVLYEKNSQNMWPIASITKLMTAVVALENLNQSSVVEITQQDIDATDGNNTFQVGDSFTVDGLIKALLMVSSNDAAYALANAMGQDNFIKKMNDKAKEISMTQTNYHEPSGLSYLNQSTAHDLYSLLIYIQKHDQLIFDTTRIKTLTIKNQTKGRPAKKLVNINEFAGRKDFLGGKTGTIDQSGENLISLFYKNGKMIYIGVFGSPDRFGETLKILSCIQ
jgi:D-alanyl-D-alanine endopeptidase (penicillin-binding protein 7)